MPFMKSPKCNEANPEVQTSRERVHIRTFEIASQAPRTNHEITQGDYEQAKKEVAAEAAAKKSVVAVNRLAAAFLDREGL